MPELLPFRRDLTHCPGDCSHIRTVRSQVSSSRMRVNTTAAAAPADWGQQIPESDWAVYRQAIHQVRALEIPFAFGGAFGLAAYTGSLRNTKDFDFYVRPVDRDAMILALTRAGLEDHFDRLPYDRSWIYRASRGEIIVDAIWAMANHRAAVDDEWVSRGPEVILRGERLRAIPIEELIWSKLYVLQRDRCDWGDVFNLLDANARSVDWERLLNRMAEDQPLMAGALEVFGWLAPDRVQEVPATVWSRLGISLRARGSSDTAADRVGLLDGRPWFTRQRR
jgi:hypothetical protein